MIVRAATQADCEAIKALHIDSWQRTYGGVLPAAYLAGPAIDDLGGLWGAGALDGRLCVVAEAGGLLGFALMAPAGAETPYLDSLHVAKAAQGKGVGRALFAWVAKALQARGHNALSLTVLSGNAGALAAYKALGGRLGAPVDADCFGNKVTDIPVYWDTLEALLEK
ncbi:MAG: GNAT superfamily N-acetyltransferase [Sulfitobacter sp.]|jgi:GNAT superfamily N-acetyltransferase